MNEKFELVMRAVGELEVELLQVPPELVASKTGLPLDEVKLCLAEARSKGLVHYFYRSTEPTALSSGPNGWALTPAGSAYVS